MPSATFCPAFSSDNLAQGSRQIGLREYLPDLGYTPVRQKDPSAALPTLNQFARLFNIADAQFINRKTISKFDCRLHHFGKRLCAKTVKRRNNGIEHTWNGCRKNA